MSNKAKGRSQKWDIKDSDYCIAFVIQSDNTMTVISGSVIPGLGDIVWLGPACFVVDRVAHNITGKFSYEGPIHVYLRKASESESEIYNVIENFNRRRKDDIDEFYIDESAARD